MDIITSYPMASGLLVGSVFSSLLFAILFSVNKRQTKSALNLLDEIIAVMPGHVYWVDLSGAYLGCNDNQAKSAGLQSRQEIYGLRNKDLPWNTNTGKLPDELDAVNKKVMTTGQTIMLEEPALRYDGTEASFLSIKAPLKNKRHEIIGMVGISIDITEKKKIEAELQKTKTILDGMTIVAASIAHELRTPLANLNLASTLIKDTLPALINTYVLAEQNRLPVEKLSPKEIAALEKKPLVIQKETRASLTFIDMLLLNLNPSMNESKIESFSISNCIDEALERFPFVGNQLELVHWKRNEENDFIVKGEHLIVTHILFNLLKNAIYYVLKAGKGDIQIWLEPGKKYNLLLFKDTGAGISKNELPHIFDRFFSKTYHGAGVGLTFCQWAMQKLRGKISCESIENDYTLFTLQFPVIKESHHD